MASKYIKKFKVPENFENILSDFAKEILRNQPKDIIDFGIEYFKGLESNTKLDYAHKGENRPENYKRPENQEPNIIHAPNNLEISQQDKNRLQRSMDKIERINKDPVPVEKKEHEEDNKDKEYGRHVVRYEEHEERTSGYTKKVITQEEVHVTKKIKIIRNGREEILPEEEQHQGRYAAYENEGHKEEYKDWFTKHSMDKQVIDYKKEEEPLDENLKRNEVGYNTWFNNHSIDKSQSGEGQNSEERQQMKQAGNMKEAQNYPKGGGKKGDKNYDDWFTKHSMDKQAIDYKKEEEPLDENLKRNEMGYNTWFNNHSIRSIDQSQSGEIDNRGGEVYSDWFNKHSRDKMVIEYKPEKIEKYGNITRCEIDYPTWFENHSKLTSK
jgi:hypothetical protein